MKLSALIQELQDLEPDEKLEFLIELGDELPALTASRAGQLFPSECLVQECQTPVYLWVDYTRDAVHLEADVPEKSPTVRGLVSLLVLGLEGATAAEIASVPDDIIPMLGLNETLGMTRRQGLRGMIGRIKRQVAEAAGSL